MKPKSRLWSYAPLAWISLKNTLYWAAPVYYANGDANFGYESPDLRENFVGISGHVGHEMTYKVLTQDTLEIISTSNVHPDTDSNALNLRAAHKNRGNDNDGFDCPSPITHHPSFFRVIMFLYVSDWPHSTHYEEIADGS